MWVYGFWPGTDGTRAELMDAVLDSIFSAPDLSPPLRTISEHPSHPSPVSDFENSAFFTAPLSIGATGY